jgi:predicted ferric reductase
MKKLLILIVVIIAFIIVLKLSAILLFWSLSLFIRWGALIIVLGALAYFGIRYLLRGQVGRW